MNFYQFGSIELTADRYVVFGMRQVLLCWP